MEIPVELLRSEIVGRGLKCLFVTPEQQLTGLLPLMSAASMLELALDSNHQKMRFQMHGKWRNRLAKAERSGLRVRTSQSAGDLDWLLRLDLMQQRAKRFRNLPPEFVKLWHAQSPCACHIYLVEQNGSPIAAMLFLDHAPGSTYQIGWTSEEGRILNVHHLVLWHATRDFADAGRRRLDLGLVDTLTSPGLARFKLGIAANLRKLASSGLVLPGKSPRKGALKVTFFGAASNGAE